MNVAPKTARATMPCLKKSLFQPNPNLHGGGREEEEESGYKYIICLYYNEKKII